MRDPFARVLVPEKLHWQRRLRWARDDGFAQLETVVWRRASTRLLCRSAMPGRDLARSPHRGQWQKMGENGVDNARLWLNEVRVPREALLDRFGKRR